MRGLLVRDTYWETGTYGILRVGGLELFTAECPWKDNQRFVSCIPDGAYTVSQHQSPKFGWCYAITGRRVTLHDEGDGSRFACLFHAANWPHQLNGCIAPGIDRKPLSGTKQWPGSLAVTESGRAMKMLLGSLPDVWQLDIISKDAKFTEPKPTTEPSS